MTECSEEGRRLATLGMRLRDRTVIIPQSDTVQVSLIPRPSHRPVFDFCMEWEGLGMRLVQVTLTYIFICM